MSLPVEGVDLLIRPDEQCVALTKGFRLIQRFKGHKYSVDDLLVAAIARDLTPHPQRVLDLGCGLGSVLLMTAWAHPTAQLVGLEAQPEHVLLAERNVTLNGCASRTHIIHGDLRDDALVTALGRFDLVTGTPPYFDPSAATVCADPQRAYAQWELRGGIEDYARAAARVLTPAGRFIACASASPLQRAAKAIEQAGLHLHFLQRVLPKPGRAPFLWLLIAGRAPHPAPEVEAEPLLLRHADGTRTQAHRRARTGFGLAASLR